MNYGLIYTVPFASLDNEDCVVEIEKEGYSGKVTELIGGSSPFTVDIETEEFLYTPTRFSTATIRIVGSDYLQSLFSIGYQQYRVTFKRKDVITWCGFIKPELYTQDYSSETFELELECASSMSTLEYIYYKQLGENRVFISLWELLRNCISSASSRYKSVILPFVYAKNKSGHDAGINVLKDMTVSEQNFFDEDDKAMTLKEILEEICKFLNWTCVDWMGELYFVDVDDTWLFDKYKPDLSEKIASVIPLTHGVQEIGFGGASHSLDILPGYSKATVKTSNYCVNEVVPEEVFNVFVRIVNGRFVPAPNPVTPGIREEEIILVEQEPSVYKTFKHFPFNSGHLLGSSLYRVCIYSLIPQNNGSYRPSINEFAYDDCICIVMKSQYPIDRTHYEVATLEQDKEVLTFLDEFPCAAYGGGAFFLSGDIAQSNNFNHYYSTTRGATTSLKLICELEIGGQFWNGSTWVKARSTFAVSVNPKGTGYTPIDSTKELGMPYKENGYIINLPDKPLAGTIKFRMYTPQAHDSVTAIYIKNFRLVFAKANDAESTKYNNTDRIYENVVNGKYIKELDEIEFKISSYNNDGSCYSKVMLDDNYLTNNLYSAIEDTNIRPEEQLIRRIIKRYSSPRIKLTQVIKAPPYLTPIARLYDNYMVNKEFINTGGTIDYKMNQFQCIMIEV